MRQSISMPIDTCTCWEAAAKEIRKCPAHHKYLLGDQELSSVSKVIREVYPKKSWDGVDKRVVEHARERGERADRYCSQYAETGDVRIQPGEWVEVIERFEIFQRWWDKNVNVKAKAQQIVYSVKDGVAGTLDFIIGPDFVIDLKNTYQPEVDWALQLGAYAEYAPASDAAILHVSPKVYEDTGCRLLRYDVEEARAMWRQAVNWWKCIQKLTQKDARRG